MKYYAISGSWRTINKEVENDVKKTVSQIIKQWDGIITWGALWVDYIATETVLKLWNPKKQLQIFLPINLDAFCKHYHKRAKEWVITLKQANEITSQLKKISNKSPESISDDTPFELANIESYYARNTTIIKECDKLFAFQVNNSQGTQDAVDKAKELWKDVVVKKYYIK